MSKTDLHRQALVRPLEDHHQGAWRLEEARDVRHDVHRDAGTAILLFYGCIQRASVSPGRLDDPPPRRTPRDPSRGASLTGAGS